MLLPPPKKIISFSLLFITVCAFARGRPEERRVKLLKENYNITAIPLTKERIGSDCVLTDDGVLFYSQFERERPDGGMPLVLYRYEIQKGEKSTIELPDTFEKRDYYYFENMTYNSVTNTIHAVIGWYHDVRSNSRMSTYYILYLDTYQWEKVLDMDIFRNGNNLGLFRWYYYPLTDRLYIINNPTSLIVFDVSSRSYLDPIPLSWENYDLGRSFPLSVLCLFDDPLRLLLLLREKNTYDAYYCIYNTETNESEIIECGQTDDYLHLQNHIHLDEYRFLCTRSNGLNAAELVEINLVDGQVTPVIDSFPYEMFSVKRGRQDNEYTFITTTKDEVLWAFGASYWSFFCFYEWQK
jgi:hypothetical protein